MAESVTPQTTPAILVRLSAEEHAALTTAAREDDRSMAATMRRALRLYLERDRR